MKPGSILKIRGTPRWHPAADRGSIVIIVHIYRDRDCDIYDISKGKIYHKVNQIWLTNNMLEYTLWR